MHGAIPAMNGKILQAMPVENACSLRSWYVVQTLPHHEELASAGLLIRGFPTYNPQEPYSVKRKYAKRMTLLRPILPGYIFTTFETADEAWKLIIPGIIVGVRRLLRYGELPIPVSAAAMDHIREVEADARTGIKRKKTITGCKVGDWVQLIEHQAFGGFFGLVIELLDEKDRIKVDVELFGRQTPVEVSVSQVRVVASE